MMVNEDRRTDLRRKCTGLFGGGRLIVASNRGPDEWLATFADPVRAQSALDRFTSRAFDLVIEGESYRTRLKPNLPAPARKGPAAHG